MTWVEAVLLFNALMSNTESLLRCAIKDIAVPYNYGDMLAIESLNLFVKANSNPKKKFERIRGVWEKDNTAKKLKTGSMPAKEAEAFFLKLGHNPNRIE